MMDLITYSYTEVKEIYDGLLPDRVTELGESNMLPRSMRICTEDLY